MGTLTGKSGKIEYAGGKVASIGSWSADVNVDIRDHTTFSTGTLLWRTRKDGLAEWSASADGFFDAASTGQTDIRTNLLTPSTGQFIGYLDKTGGENYRGSCFVSGMSVGADVDGDVTVQFQFEGTGALTYSTAT
jgi:predicted secreted protein